VAREGQRFCIGHGKTRDCCGQPIDHEALGLNQSGLFCVNCELNRRESITRQMAAISKSFDQQEGEHRG